MCISEEMVYCIKSLNYVFVYAFYTHHHFFHLICGFNAITLPNTLPNNCNASGSTVVVYIQFLGHQREKWSVVFPRLRYPVFPACV